MGKIVPIRDLRNEIIGLAKMEGMCCRELTSELLALVFELVIWECDGEKEPITRFIDGLPDILKYLLNSKELEAWVHG